MAAGVKDLAAELMITFRATRLGQLLVQDPKAPNPRLTQHQIGKQTQNRCVLNFLTASKPNRDRPLFMKNTKPNSNNHVCAVTGTNIKQNCTNELFFHKDTHRHAQTYSIDNNAFAFSCLNFQLKDLQHQTCFDCQLQFENHIIILGNHTQQHMSHTASSAQFPWPARQAQPLYHRW